jgi:hypothetical protein
LLCRHERSACETVFLHGHGFVAVRRGSTTSSALQIALAINTSVYGCDVGHRCDARRTPWLVAATGPWCCPVGVARATRSK